MKWHEPSLNARRWMMNATIGLFAIVAFSGAALPAAAEDQAVDVGGNLLVELGGSTWPLAITGVPPKQMLSEHEYTVTWTIENLLPIPLAVQVRSVDSDPEICEATSAQPHDDESILGYYVLGPNTDDLIPQPPGPQPDAQDLGLLDNWMIIDSGGMTGSVPQGETRTCTTGIEVFISPFLNGPEDLVLRLVRDFVGFDVLGKVSLVLMGEMLTYGTCNINDDAVIAGTPLVPFWIVPTLGDTATVTASGVAAHSDTSGVCDSDKGRFELYADPEGSAGRSRFGFLEKAEPDNPVKAYVDGQVTLPVGTHELIYRASYIDCTFGCKTDKWAENTVSVQVVKLDSLKLDLAANGVADAQPWADVQPQI